MNKINIISATILDSIPKLLKQIFKLVLLSGFLIGICWLVKLFINITITASDWYIIKYAFSIALLINAFIQGLSVLHVYYTKGKYSKPLSATVTLITTILCLILIVLSVYSIYHLSGLSANDIGYISYSRSGPYQLVGIQSDYIANNAEDNQHSLNAIILLSSVILSLLSVIVIFAVEKLLIVKNYK